MHEMNMAVPDGVLKVLERLEQKGYEAYVVGGCVRDAILGIEPHDWDICTSAKPDEVMEAFSNEMVVPTGIQHGTVTVVPYDRTAGDEGYEITTFRADAAYSDGRHPDSVAFVSDIREDLARRDFTINAMAYSPKTGLVDPFNGRRDLMDKKLRCVGSADDRFAEDSLRIMRAVRFAANYGLTIEDGTDRAIRQSAHTLDRVSKERITAELVKMFSKAECPGGLLNSHKEVLFSAIPAMKPCDGYKQHTPWHQHDVLTHILKTVDAVDMGMLHGEQLATVRLAALLHDIGKPDSMQWSEDGQVMHFNGHAHASAELAEQVMAENLRLTAAMQKQILMMIERHDDRHGGMPSPKKLVNRAGGAENARLLVCLQKADVIAHGDLGAERNEEKQRELAELDGMLESIAQIELNNDAVAVKDLAVSGKDLMSMGLKPGPEFSMILNSVLDEVLDGMVENEHGILMQRAFETAERIYGRHETVYADIPDILANMPESLSDAVHYASDALNEAWDKGIDEYEDRACGICTSIMAYMYGGGGYRKDTILGSRDYAPYVDAGMTELLPQRYEPKSENTALSSFLGIMEGEMPACINMSIINAVDLLNESGIGRNAVAVECISVPFFENIDRDAEDISDAFFSAAGRFLAPLAGRIGIGYGMDENTGETCLKLRALDRNAFSLAKSVLDGISEEDIMAEICGQDAAEYEYDMDEMSL